MIYKRDVLYTSYVQLIYYTCTQARHCTLDVSVVGVSVQHKLLYDIKRINC